MEQIIATVEYDVLWRFVDPFLCQNSFRSGVGVSNRINPDDCGQFSKICCHIIISIVIKPC